MIDIIAQTASSGITGNLHIALGAAAAALGVGMIGTKAVEAVGRNPGASGKSSSSTHRGGTPSFTTFVAD